MRVIVLSWSPHGNAADPRSDALLAARARLRGADATIVRATRDGAAAPRVARGDVVLPRADLRSEGDLAWFAAQVRSADRAGARCLPSARGLLAAEDKDRTLRRLERAGVAQPATVGARALARLPTDSAERAAGWTAELLGGGPVVVKPAVEWGGQGQVRCDDAAALVRALAWSRTAKTKVLVQDFVEHFRSVTVLVAGGRALSAWEQRRDPGAQPGTCAADPATSAAAVQAARICGLAFASVDFLDRGDGRPLLCVDVNSMPGLWPDDPDDIAFADAMIGCAMGQR
jgi:glutathione synthase/RimK-type ligase-like ATP-grasp enzyme